jgi:uncharacterized protein
MRYTVALLAGVVFAFAATGQAGAQGAVLMATSGQGTMTYSLGSAIAGLLGDREGMRAVVQPQSGTGVALPLVNSGELDIGFASAIEVGAAYAGEGEFRRPNPELRIVGRLFVTRVGLLVRANSDIRSISDLRGRTVAYGFSSTPHIQDTMDALLANGGLTAADVRTVRVPSLIRGADDLASGTVAATTFALGAAKVSEIHASAGGIRYLPLDDSEEAIARMQAVLPLTYLAAAEPGPTLAGIDAPMMVMGYDYLIFAGPNVADEVVYRITRSIAENQSYLAESFANFQDLEPALMAEGDYGIPYHEGAIRYYREAGLWNRE